MPGGSCLRPRGNGLVFWGLFACLFVSSSTDRPSLGLGLVWFVPRGLGNITGAGKGFEHPSHGLQALPLISRQELGRVVASAGVGKATAGELVLCERG